MSPAKAVLLLPIRSLNTPHEFSAAIREAATSTTEQLRIILVSPIFSLGGCDPIAQFDDLQRILTFTYVQATAVAQNVDRILMDIDVLLRAPENAGDQIDSVEMLYRVEGDDTPLPQGLASLPLTILPGPQTTQTPSSPSLPSPSEPAPPLPRVAALGGTFDHLHAGHKILLTAGAMLCSEKLIVGVTTDALLASKSNAAYLESLSERKARVRGFLQIIKPHIIHDVVTIDDVYGPTGWDPDIQVLVVSHETISGADAIARHRESKGLPPLRPFVIDVISHDDPKLDHQDAALLKNAKMSSTFIRAWIASKQNA